MDVFLTQQQHHLRPLKTTTTTNNNLSTLSEDNSSPVAQDLDVDFVVESSRKRKLPRAKAAYPRKRALQACRTCRLRRTKCDNEHPACTSCVGLGIECFYQAGDPSTFDPASLAILQRLDTLESLLREKNTATAGETTAGDQDLTSPSSLPKNLDSPALERTASPEPCFINIEAVLSWSVFDDLVVEQQLDLRSLLNVAGEADEPPAMTMAADFERCAAGDLLQQFLDNVHIFNPVLEESKVRGYMREARFNGLGWDARSCLLLLICALGSISASYGKVPITTSSTFRQSTNFGQADSFFLAAQKRMGMLLCRSGVIEAQCFFLAGVYLMATLRPIEAWKMFVQALACCQGFHSHLRVYDSGQEEERQLEESIYWTCFKSELELRLELNLAEKSVWDLTYPAFFPTPPKGLKSQGEAVWYFYLAEIALRRLGNRILNYIYRHESTPAHDSQLRAAVSNFEEQATGWLDSLPTTLNLDTADEEGSGCAALKFILNGHLLDCYEMMYWPFVVDAVHSRLRGEAAHAFARKGLLVCVQRIQKNESGFYHRHHGTWLMLRSCTRSALVLLGAARSPGLTDLLPPDWQQAIHKVTNMLSYWKDESRDVLDRLQILEKLLVSVVRIDPGFDT